MSHFAPFKITTPEGVFTLETVEDREDDNIKLMHTLLDAAGKDTGFDWSPYSDPSSEDICRWLALGRPNCGSMNRDDLNLLEKQKAA